MMNTRFDRIVVLVCGIAGSISLCIQSPAQEATHEAEQNGDVSVVVTDGSMEMYRKMLEAGMISEEDYAHVLLEGRLPGGQHANGAAGEASVNIQRKLPQRKQLSHKARNAKVAAGLKSFSKRMRTRDTARREETERRGRERGLTLRRELSNGGIIQLDYFDDLGFPQYKATDTANAAKTISTDLVWPFPDPTNDFFRLKGDTITMGVWEGGAVRMTHDDLRHYTPTSVVDAVTLKDSALTEYGLSSHATAVAGTMVGGYYTWTKGMSYNGNLHAYDWDFYLSELADAATNHVYRTIHMGWLEDGDSLPQHGIGPA